MKRFTAILLLAALLLCGCGEKAEEAEQTTVSGMVISVDGTKVELMSTEGMSMGNNRPNRGENSEEGNYPRPQGGNRPEGDFTWPEGEFTMPEGFEDFNGQMPEGFENFGGGNMPNFGGQMPEGDFTMPEGFGEGEMPTMPEGMGGRFNREDMETTTVDLAEAHISLELEDGSKAAGTMSDITVGSRLTITMEGDKAVRVVVSQNSFRGFGGFGGQGGFGGNRGNWEGKNDSKQENS